MSVLEGVRFEAYRSGAPSIAVTAAGARIQGEDVAELDHVQIEFQAGDRGSVQVRAERGRLDLDTHDFELHGGVVGSTGAGEHFTSDELRYDEIERRLWTDRPVRVERGNLVTEGDGLRIDLANQRVQIQGRVRATLGAP